MFPEITRDDVFRLETPRLWLRWPRAADGEAIAQHCSDPDVALNTANIPHPYALADAERFVFEARAGNTMGEKFVLALALKQKPNDVIGVIGAHGAPGRGATRLGYWLGKPYWSQGLMGEAAGAFVDLLFSVTSVQTIEFGGADDERGIAAPSGKARLRLPRRRRLRRAGARRRGERRAHELVARSHAHLLWRAARQTDLDMSQTRTLSKTR